MGLIFPHVFWGGVDEGRKKPMFETINLTDLAATMILISIQSIQDKDISPPVNQVLA